MLGWRLLGVVALLGLSISAQAAETVTPVVRTFLDNHCLTCHSSANKKGNLDLTALVDELADGNFAKWVKVHDRIRSGEMPPQNRPRPPVNEVRAITQALDSALLAFDQRRLAPIGRTVARRLNRTEYENTLRDLLDLPWLNVAELLPEDGRAFGYDKSGSGLDISTIQMAKYLEAADRALDMAIAQTAAPPQAHRERMFPPSQYDYSILLSNGDAVALKDGQRDPEWPLVADKWLNHGEMHRAGWFKRPVSIALLRPQDEAFQGRFSSFVTHFPGRYRVRLSIWGLQWNKGQAEASPRTETVAVRAINRLVGNFDAPSLKPTVHDFETYLQRDEYFTVNGASLWPIRVSELKGRTADYVGPGVAIDWLEIEGPIWDVWPPTSHKILFGDTPLVPLSELGSVKPPIRKLSQRTHHGSNPPGRFVWATVKPNNPAATAEKLLRDFLPRAFRRPVDATEVYRYLAVVAQKLATGACFEDAMRAAYKNALCSPDFLFIREPVGPLSDAALANRLAYFLWAGPPDGVLQQLAEQGKLREPAVLRGQADRLLADPRAERFVNDFLDQWLDLREIDLTTPDRALYPEFSPLLRDSMLGEPRAFFRELLKRNAPASNLVRSDFLTINQPLAELYGIANVQGNTYRVVTNPPDVQRGGFLTQAAILKVTANGTTTSPVKRGAWVQRKIIGRPPEPPPPDVAAVEPDVRGTTTIRELLAKHRDQASCAACHAYIDPPGFALESFDVIGTRRERYRSLGQGLPAIRPAHISSKAHIGYRMGPPIDSSGTTPSGQPFKDIDDYRQLLLKDERSIAHNFLAQLLTYSTGCPPQYADRPALEQILDRTAGTRFGIRSLILELVTSSPFLIK